MSAREQESVWRRRIETFEASGLTMTAWCRRERMNVSSMYRWRNRLRSRLPVKGPLIPITVRSEPVSAVRAGLVATFGDLRIEADGRNDPRWLSEVLRGLRG